MRSRSSGGKEKKVVTSLLQGTAMIALEDAVMETKEIV
jgi:hypothetical protein